MQNADQIADLLNALNAAARHIEGMAAEVEVTLNPERTRCEGSRRFAVDGRCAECGEAGATIGGHWRTGIGFGSFAGKSHFFLKEHSRLRTTDETFQDRLRAAMESTDGG